MKLTSTLLLALAAPSGETPCSTTAVHAGGEKDVVATALAAGEFRTLAQALQAAGLVEALQGPGPFTVFAPTDAAFAQLPKETLASLLRPENAASLRTILTYHVVAGDVRAADVVALRQATALNGQRLSIQVADGAVAVAGAKVVKTDLACTNGVIHVVDRVLMPATKDLVTTAVDAGRFTILAKALGAAGLVEALSAPGPFTVFAPSDDAFRALPKETLEELLRPEKKHELVALLKHHVVPGRVYADQLSTGDVKTLGGTKLPIEIGANGPRVDGAAVTTADVETANGVIHVVDRVLIPGA